MCIRDREVVVEQSEEDKEIAELEAKLAAAKKKQAEDSDCLLYTSRCV